MLVIFVKYLTQLIFFLVILNSGMSMWRFACHVTIYGRYHMLLHPTIP